MISKQQESLISIQNLAVTLNGNLIINNFSLDLMQKENIAIIGKTGSGKTTIFKTILKFYPCKYESFEIFGEDFTEIKQNSLGKLIGFSFQSPETQFIKIHIKDEINNAVSDDKESKKFLDTFKFKLNLNLNPHKLSQSEKRILTFACLFNNEKELFLLDEPTSDLDPKNRKVLFKILCELNKPFIIFSHDLEFIEALKLNKTIKI